MSFWSSLVLARTAPPPIVTAAALGRFVSNLAATGALAENDAPTCQIKYGSQVDGDERPVDVIDYDDSGIVGTFKEYPWDRSDTFPSLDAMASALLADGGTVYRARLSLGAARHDVIAALTRDPCEENESPLCLWDVNFRVEPVSVAGLGSEAAAFVGWMGLSFSGPGYFFPWQYRQAKVRAEAVELVRRMAYLCRTTWPVSTMAASAEAIASRRRLAELWLYDDFALPPGWLWFVSESG
jgi:hypothetical protein